MSLEKILFDTKHFLKQFFGVIPSKSKYYFYNKDWSSFLKNNGLNVFSEGVFLPHNLSAHINFKSPFFISNFLHEYFGHGIFYEHSILGKKIVFYSKKDPYKASSILKKNDFLIESFALFIEYISLNNLNNAFLFYKKLEEYNDNVLEQFLFSKNMFSNYGLLYLQHYFSLPKNINEKNVLEVLRKKSEYFLKNSYFIIHYGSKKPFSDIDFFIVSKESFSYYDGFLDLYVLSKEDFENKISLLDISVTDPLFSGTLIYGDKNYYLNSKKRVLNTPITSESIKHNYKMSELQKLALKSKNVPIPKKTIESYSKSYFLNALALKKGEKKLVLNSL